MFIPEIHSQNTTTRLITEDITILPIEDTTILRMGKTTVLPIEDTTILVTEETMLPASEKERLQTAGPIKTKIYHTKSHKKIILNTAIYHINELTKTSPNMKDKTNQKETGTTLNKTDVGKIEFNEFEVNWKDVNIADKVREAFKDDGKIIEKKEAHNGIISVRDNLRLHKEMLSNEKVEKYKNKNDDENKKDKLENKDSSKSEKMIQGSFNGKVTFKKKLSPYISYSRLLLNVCSKTPIFRKQ